MAKKKPKNPHPTLPVWAMHGCKHQSLIFSGFSPAVLGLTLKAPLLLPIFSGLSSTLAASYATASLREVFVLFLQTWWTFPTMAAYFGPTPIPVQILRFLQGSCLLWSLLWSPGWKIWFLRTSTVLWNAHFYTAFYHDKDHFSVWQCQYYLLIIEHLLAEYLGHIM